MFKKLGIPVLRYFASEVCENAIRVQTLRHPDVIQIGDVRCISEDVLSTLGRIDLLLAGSPCSDLSRVNPRRAGLRGGSGLLYFEFVRILRHLQDTHKDDGHCVMWLFENTSHLDSTTLLQLNRDMGQPSLRCASDYLPIRRRRYYWGNIPNLHREAVVTSPPVELQDVIDRNKRALVCQARTLTSNRSGQCPVQYNGEAEHLSPTDFERLQGLEPHYTDANLSVTARVALLAKGWCVPVVCSILAELIPVFS